MRNRGKRYLAAGITMLASFALWTVLVLTVDVLPVGQNGTDIGFASLNVWFHHLTGVHMEVYTITDWLGLVPIVVCAGFGLFGLAQWIRRRSLKKVDPDLLLLGGYYILVIFGYLLFERIPINYRPIPINGAMEVSYPSSTTLLILSVMPTLKFQIDRRASRIEAKRLTTLFVILFSAFMVLGRLVSGVHWLTDIVGAVFLSAGLYLLYCASVAMLDESGK